MISCLFSLCCQRLQIAAFVCLKTPFDISVDPFELLMRLNVCSSCSAVVNSRILCFPFLNVIHCLCGNPPLVVGFPRTQHLIACQFDHAFHCHLTSMVFSSISSCRARNLLECDTEFLPFIGIIQRKGVIPQTLVCLLCPVPPHFEPQPSGLKPHLPIA